MQELVACQSCGRVFDRRIVEGRDSKGNPTNYRRVKGGVQGQTAVACPHLGCGNSLLCKVDGVLVTPTFTVSASSNLEAESVEEARATASETADAVTPE